jgi:predicted transposase YbfD/YdcC
VPHGGPQRAERDSPLFTALLDRIQITGAIITADALHAQREHATCLAGRGAHYLLIVKRNQPSLYAQPAAIIRGHWGIEDRLHWARGIDFGEDRSQARTASGPRVMASLRNLAITILRLSGAASIAAALRYHARQPSRPFRAITRC